MFNFFKRAVESSDPSETVIYLRSMKVPAQHWTATVKYDAWGHPYTNSPNGHGASFGCIGLKRDGKTNETWLYGTEWRHKSGPPVVFKPAPSMPFEAAN